ncbi:MAG: hypothetical protein R3D55_20870 [Chloroflexota bacterium]
MSAETDPQPEEPQSENETTAVELVTATAESTELEAPAPQLPAPQAPANRRERKPKKGKPGAGKSGKSQSSLRQVADRFAACGRCSYFWAGYKVLFGEEGQETAVNQSEDGWLDLQWNGQMPNLLLESYGIRMDVDFFHYEGCCKECRRRFLFHAAEDEAEPASLAIEISPHKVK